MHSGYRQVRGPACGQNGKVQRESGTCGKRMLTPSLTCNSFFPASRRIQITQGFTSGKFSLGFLVRVDSTRQRLRGHQTEDLPFYPLLSST